MQRNRLIGRSLIHSFLTGGNAYFTVVNPASGSRYTFRVRQAPTEPSTGNGQLRPQSPGQVPFFVSVLTGPDNEHMYSYLGTLWPNGRFVYGKKSHIGQEAPSFKCFAWLTNALSSENADQKLDRIEFWHEGRCGRCGRKLTVPESIESGIGPVCEGR